MSAARGDTIVAVASGQGRAAICVLRLSGPQTYAILQSCLGRLPDARRASLRRLRDPETHDLLDEALVLWLPGPSTFTGEDQAELHLHGGIAVRSAVLRMLLDQPSCRAAEAGEFTRRAFLNGRLDLTAVEGLADLIDAETDAQRRQALRQMDGGLAKPVLRWRESLVDALAHCDASLDFTDESDVPDDVFAPSFRAVSVVRQEMREALDGVARGERIRDGFVVVIAGAPNAGKSSLLNAIAKRDVAIVSAVPGTTRDVLEVRCDLDGWPITFVDTAGLRDTTDEVEREGVARASRRMANADLILWLAPTDEPADLPTCFGNEAWRITTKSDLLLTSADVGLGRHVISAVTSSGLPDLLAAVRDAASRGVDGGADAVLTRERHRLVLRDACEALDRAVDVMATGAVELVAEDLRLALRALGRMTGQVGVEEILDRIFASFCIGK